MLKTDIKGRYFDGLHAEPHEVVVKVSSLEVRGYSSDRTLLFRWDISNINLIHEMEGTKPAIFSHKQNTDERLYIQHPELFEEIRRNLPQKSKKAQFTFPKKEYVMGVLIAFGTILAMLPQLIIWGADHIPDSWEENLGEFAVMAFTEGSPTCNSLEGNAVLDKIQHQFADAAGSDNRFHIQVVEDEMVNAFAAPGGEIILFSGLINSAESIDEVAGVLAHEMAHEIENHPTEGILRSLGYSFAFQFIFGDISEYIDIASLGEILLKMNYSRNDEREADRIAQEILIKTGVGTEGFKRFFERLQEKEIMNADFLVLFSTHPDLEERIATLEQSGRGQQESFLTEEDWEDLKNICYD